MKSWLPANHSQAEAALWPTPPLSGFSIMFSAPFHPRTCSIVKLPGQRSPPEAAHRPTPPVDDQEQRGIPAQPH